MFIYIARLIVVIAGPVIGYFQISPDGKGILIGTAVAVLVIAAELLIQSVRLDDLVAGFMGLLLGLIAASFLKYVIPALFDSPPVTGAFERYSLMMGVVFAYMGMLIALRKKDELDLLDREFSLTSRSLSDAQIKVVDTSSIIDSRLIDIGNCGFLEGTLVIPSPVLAELQTSADSPDDEKRKRGRRALDIVNEMRENKKISCKIYQKDYPDIEQTDAKLIKLCQELKAKLVTCDFNLNKVARAQGVEVLNVNELANALKAKLLPGEAVEIFILKRGRDRDQGVGFLEDGTMVVVDGGKNYIGSKVEVTVSTVLQKPSGRMVFARVN